MAVTDGVVTIQGTPESAELGHNLVTKIRHVIGVVAVRDELTYPPPSGPSPACTSERGKIMSMAQAAGHAYALLADGSTVEIRPAGLADFGAVKAMHEAMSPDNTYTRLFSLSKLAAETEARRICRDPQPGHAALLAASAGEVVGCASYEALGGPAGPGSVAEIAFTVADHMHHRGIATLLLEHLVSLARSYQITVFTAQTLSENTSMLKVFADAGLPVQRHYEDGVMNITIPAAHPARWNRPGQLPGSRGRAGTPGGYRQPPARAWPPSQSWSSARAGGGAR